MRIERDAIELQFRSAYTFYYAHAAQLPADNTLCVCVYSISLVYTEA